MLELDFIQRRERGNELVPQPLCLVCDPHMTGEVEAGWGWLGTGIQPWPPFLPGRQIPPLDPHENGNNGTIKLKPTSQAGRRCCWPGAGVPCAWRGRSSPPCALLRCCGGLPPSVAWPLAQREVRPAGNGAGNIPGKGFYKTLGKTTTLPGKGLWCVEFTRREWI